jgi:LacI family transcriptional regulator
MTNGHRTIKDLARELGVSAATISRALAGNPRISQSMRDKVVEAARVSGYVRNRAAQSLVTGRGTGFAGLVLTDPGYGREDSYLGDFIAGLGQGLSENSIDLFLAAIPTGQSELSVIRNIVETRRADGLILARTTEADPRVDYLCGAGFPFVTHGRVLNEAAQYSWVDTDGTWAFAEAFDLLYALGHRRFGFVTIKEPMTFRLHRTEGVLLANDQRGDPAVSVSVASSVRFDAGLRHAAIRDLLTRPERPTAILALFDGLALAVIEEAAALGLSVPGDLSVIGFDNIASAAHARPGLTTFDSDTTGAARSLAAMLAARIDPKGRDLPPETKLIRPKLVLRGSHGTAPR